MFQPLVKVVLQGIDGVIYGGAERHPEELIQRGSMESFDEAVGERVLYLGLAVFDIVQGQLELVGVGVGATVLPSVVRQDGVHRNVPILVEGQHIVVYYRHGGFWEVAGMQKPEGVAAIRIDHGIEVDLANPFELAHIKQILTQQRTRTAGPDMPFAKAGIGPLDEGDLHRS